MGQTSTTPVQPNNLVIQGLWIPGPPSGGAFGLQNTGLVPAEDVIITITPTNPSPANPLPINITPTVGTASSDANGVITWNIGNLAPFGIATITFEQNPAPSGQQWTAVSQSSNNASVNITITA